MSLGQSKCKKKCPFFFYELQLISFTFDSRFLCEMKYMVRLSKSVCVIFHF